MTIRLYKADALTKIEYWAKLASYPLVFDDLVYINAEGYVARATNAGIVPLGLVQATIASTDPDYASATMIPILVPGPDAEFLCDVGTGTPADTDVGEWIDIDDYLTVDVDTSSYDIFYVTRIISATQVLAKMARKSGAAA